VEADALLDTGSTTSAITPRIAKELGLRQLGKRPLGSAQGLGQAERYLFRIRLRTPADVPTFPFLFDEVSGFELSDSFQLDALIGMDILKQCDFSMSRTGTCTLTFG
jgi:predicted aspartyl protease